MIKKEQEKKNLAQIFKEADAVISMRLRDGFANITFDENGKHTVQFLDEEGWAGEDMQIEAKDVEKVGAFLKALQEVRLNNYDK